MKSGKKHNKLLQDIVSRLFFINKGAKHIRDNAREANIKVVLNGTYPSELLYLTANHCRSAKIECIRKRNGNLQITMKYCSIRIIKSKRK